MFMADRPGSIEFSWLAKPHSSIDRGQIFRSSDTDKLSNSRGQVHLWLVLRISSFSMQLG
jgi:hypothetical protein